ncbi:uncharacterized protein LOC111388897 [Olea europaea var. sylvestris]|uniref:Uncharacterized protein n=1 Tax=Olea europaea subsp. europaea TaxID=158383 RepID=A0A8S0RXM8_OLEEU|nr:uncharacterized protein LOC111388897 [Olea europaea var. sylvestris]CAA2984868.1 Hypothetical predicted protein [Olea europaea subsp. europaea]
MEVSIPSDTSAPQNLSSLSELPTDLPDSAHNHAEDLSINDLQNCLIETLTTEDVEISTCGFTPSLEKNDISNAVRKHENEDSNASDLSNLSSEKCISKCATFPPFGEHKSSAKELCNRKGKQGNDITAKSVDQSYSRAISLPTPSKLVSAIKGSREKLGMPPQKQSVTWAPDVYDPAPTAVSHVLSNKSQSHQSDSKKSGKNKQKGGGKSSRGSKGKGKKQNLKKSAAQIHYTEVVF